MLAGPIFASSSSPAFLPEGKEVSVGSFPEQVTAGNRANANAGDFENGHGAWVLGQICSLPCLPPEIIQSILFLTLRQERLICIQTQEPRKRRSLGGAAFWLNVSLLVPSPPPPNTHTHTKRA